MKKHVAFLAILLALQTSSPALASKQSDQKAVRALVVAFFDAIAARSRPGLEAEKRKGVWKLIRMSKVKCREYDKNGVFVP